MSENSIKTIKNNNNNIFSGGYWRDAAINFTNTRMQVFAALIVALRVIVKLFRIPLAAGLSLTFDAYINALGSIVYGPLVALGVGAVSDTIGCIVAPVPGVPYFFPFIFVEMASAFIFALFLWRQNLSVSRVLLSKFSVNLICNIILTSIFMKWSYFVNYGIEKAEAYALINLTRIVKNLILFPLESVVIVIVLCASIPVLKKMALLKKSQNNLKLKSKHIVYIVLLTLFSVALILFYIFWFKDFISAHNFKLF